LVIQKRKDTTTAPQELTIEEIVVSPQEEHAATQEPVVEESIAEANSPHEHVDETIAKGELL